MATTVPMATTPVRRSGIAAGSIRSTATAVMPITAGLIPCSAACIEARLLMRSNMGSTVSISRKEGR
jgi:hypothetical protein